MNYCQFRNDFIKRMAHAGGGAILPDEYQQVEYLWSSAAESGNTTYIKTGFIPTQRFKTEVKVQYREARGLMACGAFQSSSSRLASYGIIGDSDSGMSYRYANPNSTFSTYTWTSIAPFVLAEDVTLIEDWITPLYTVVKNGTAYTSTPNNYFPTFNSNEFFLFGRNQAGNVLNKGSMKIYYTKMYDSTNQLARDFIPCYRKSDNKPGMYDLVTDTFFTNAGTGEFTVGNNV